MACSLIIKENAIMRFWKIYYFRRKEVLAMKNIGKTDKIIRIILALILFSLFFILQGNLRFIALIGFVPLITAIVGVMPVVLAVRD